MTAIVDEDRLAQARAALGEGRLEDAELAVRAHLRAAPRDPAGLRLLADIAVRCGAFAEAERMLRHVIAADPDDCDSCVDLAKTLHRAGRADEALALLDRALAGDPGHLVAHSFKAAVLVHLRRLDEGRQAFEALLARHPGESRAWMNYAYLLKTVGRIDESIAAYRRSVALDPLQGEAWWGLANLKTFRFSGADVAAMEAALADPGLRAPERVNIGFALGRAFADRADHAAAWTHYAEANRLRRAEAPHDAARVTQDVARAEAMFTPRFFAERAGQGDPAPDPVFILGMPRSGSTLVEQILASHSRVEGTEELYDVERIALALAQEAGGGTRYLDRLAALDGAGLARLGASYLASTRTRRETGKPYFTDKMPANWIYTGLILSILPNARIVDIRRHPLACGWGNFVQHFHWGINFSYDLADIGHFYRDYVRMMDHLDRVAPGRVHRIFYEDLVADPEGETRRLIGYLGLEFEEACLRFHENRRAVHTPSAEQVRRPIGREGLEAWRPYERWLGPLKEALGPVLAAYPAVPDPASLR